ncbi:hypothetical protein [Pseudomonas sp. UMAB-40]|uniref:hypothetical protein n=1 Tax=Pseudomonas sp. UMAB-40 TaxID=1365407 RepID=UPI001C5763C4|nr:hypothetical protein [Pseudomonas sp. UMAB-40]
MELNETLKVLACTRPDGVRETYPEYDVHYHRMQQVAFVVAKQLMSMPQGTLANFDGCNYLGVAPYAGKLEVVVIQDSDGKSIDGEVSEEFSWHYLGPVPFEDLDMGGEEEIDEFSALMEKWLESPKFHQLVPADKLDLESKAAEEWAIAYAAEREREKLGKA